MTAPEPVPYARPINYASTDAGHIRALAICHYVWGALVMFLSCIFLIHVGMGIAMVGGAFSNTAGSGGQPPPPFLGWLFILMGCGAITLGWAVGILTILSGRWMTQRRRRVFSLVMAGINCASFPLGTLLGVFTFIVLLRPTVKAAYDGLA